MSVPLTDDEIIEAFRAGETAARDPRGRKARVLWLCPYKERPLVDLWLTGHWYGTQLMNREHPVHDGKP